MYVLLLIFACKLYYNFFIQRKIYASAAIYATTYAIIEHLKEIEPKTIQGVKAVYGISLGELVALPFAGAFSFSDGLNFVNLLR